MNTAAAGKPARKPIPFLIVFLTLTALLFVGILVYTYVEAKRANPVMLDEKGAIR